MMIMFAFPFFFINNNRFALLLLTPKEGSLWKNEIYTQHFISSSFRFWFSLARRESSAGDHTIELIIENEFNFFSFFFASSTEGR